MKTIGAFEAKTQLSKLLANVANGERYLITVRGKPTASLGSVSGETRQDTWTGFLFFAKK